MPEDVAVLGIKVKSGDIVKATKRLDKMERQSKKTTKQNRKLKDSFAAIAVGAFAVGMAFRAVIKNSAESERAISQLDAAVKSTGASAGFTSKELQNLASSLQDVSTFGDEAIMSAEAILLTFTKLQGDVLPRTTQAVLDLSTRMGTDLPSSAVMLGKALNDPIANLGALGRAGIQFSKDQTEMIKTMAKTGKLAEAQIIILKEMETQFGGSAKAARDTFGGALEGLSNAFGDLLEGPDGNLNDAKKATEELVTILKDPGTQKAFAVITSGIIDITSAVIKGIVALNSFGTAIGKFIAPATATQLDSINEKISETGHRIEMANTQIERSQGAVTAKTIRATEALKLLNAEQKINLSIREQLVKSSGSEEKSPVTPLLNEELTGKKEKTLEEMTLTSGDAFGTDVPTDENELETLANRLNEERAIQEEHEIEKNALMTKYTEERIKQAEDEAAAKEATQAKMWGSLTGLMSSGSKQLFEIGKVAAIAQGTLSLYESVTSAYAAGSRIGGPIVGGAFAVAAGAAQAMNLAKIASAGFSGGGASPAGAGPSPSIKSTAPPGSGQSTDAPAQPVAQELRVVVEGDGPHSEGMRKFAENLAETIKDMGGVQTLVLS